MLIVALYSGVSMAFKRHCGRKLQQEMDMVRKDSIQRQTPIQQGDVVATSSGEANNFRYALHAAVINYDRGIGREAKKPSLQTIKLILLNTEPYLQWFSGNFSTPSTIVFPYLGCGVGGLNKCDVHGLFESFSQRETSFDATIKLCDYGQ